jgi:flavodoxin
MDMRRPLRGKTLKTLKKENSMKIVSLVLFAVVFAGSQAACQGGRQQSAPSPEPGNSVTIQSGNDSVATPPESGGNILIAYFTWADNTIVANPAAVNVDATTSASVLAPGNTARMAQWIRQETGGDLFSIRVTNPYPSDYNKCLDRASEEKARNARPALTGQVANIDAYDVIFLGYPNWWYSVPMALFSFIERHNLSGKTVILFCAHGTGGLARSVQDITAALPDSTIVKNVLGVYRNDMSSAQARVKRWLTEIGY